MSTVPDELKYTKDHEWIKIEGKTAKMGITNFAQSELGELVFVDLPEVGKTFNQGDTLCVVESTKAASDVYAPLSGKVVEINSSVSGNAGLVNSSPYNDGWLVKFEPTNAKEIDSLMSANDYRKIVGG